MAVGNVGNGRIRNIRNNQTLPLVKHCSDQQRLECMRSPQPSEVEEVAWTLRRHVTSVRGELPRILTLTVNTLRYATLFTRC
jgi:hypothetical protein